METAGFEKNMGRNKMPWLLLLSVLFWYTLYGLGLWATYQPPLFWLIGFSVAGVIAAAVSTFQLVAVPLIFAATWLIGLRLILDTIIIRGSEDLSRLVSAAVSKGWQGGLIYGAMTLLLAAFWFSPLFFAMRQMKRKGLGRSQIFWGLAIASWIGLLFGWLVSHVLN
jgi:hypothetical protein